MFITDFLPDIALFGEVPWWGILVVFLSYFIGFLLRGALGFGSNMLVVVLTTPVLGPHHAVVMAAVASFFAQIDLLPQGVRTADWRVAPPLIGGLLVGTALGAWMLTLWKAEWLEVTIGILIITIVGMEQLKLTERLFQRINLESRKIGASFAVIAGSVGTLSGGGALYLLYPYVKMACPLPVTFRGTNLLLSGFSLTARFASLMVAGLVSLPILLETVLLLPAIFLGTWIGSTLFRRTSVTRFWTLLQWILISGAVIIIVRGLLRLF